MSKAVVIGLAAVFTFSNLTLFFVQVSNNEDSVSTMHVAEFFMGFLAIGFWFLTSFWTGVSVT